MAKQPNSSRNNRSKNEVNELADKLREIVQDSPDKAATILTDWLDVAESASKNRPSPKKTPPYRKKAS